MKKFSVLMLLAFGILLFSGEHSYARCCIVQKCGGGPNGYENKWESHDGDTDRLRCEDPGSKDCKWTSGPGCPKSVLDSIEGLVRESINSDRLTGESTFEGYRYTWTATNATCYQMNVYY